MIAARRGIVTRRSYLAPESLFYGITSMLHRTRLLFIVLTIVANQGFLGGETATAAPEAIDRRCLSELERDGPRAWGEIRDVLKDVSVTLKEQRVDDNQEGTRPVSRN